MNSIQFILISWIIYQESESIISIKLYHIIYFENENIDPSRRYPNQNSFLFICSGQHESSDDKLQGSPPEIADIPTEISENQSTHAPDHATLSAKEILRSSVVAGILYWNSMQWHLDIQSKIQNDKYLSASKWICMYIFVFLI